jgi:hypothetical protein
MRPLKYIFIVTAFFSAVCRSQELNKTIYIPKKVGMEGISTMMTFISSEKNENRGDGKNIKELKSHYIFAGKSFQGWHLLLVGIEKTYGVEVYDYWEIGVLEGDFFARTDPTAYLTCKAKISETGLKSGDLVRWTRLNEGKIDPLICLYSVAGESGEVSRDKLKPGIWVISKFNPLKEEGRTIFDSRLIFIKESFTEVKFGDLPKLPDPLTNQIRPRTSFGENYRMNLDQQLEGLKNDQ